eukprot:6466856-Karenia_brevis.AAC.1
MLPLGGHQTLCFTAMLPLGGHQTLCFTVMNDAAADRKCFIAVVPTSIRCCLLAACRCGSFL